MKPLYKFSPGISSEAIKYFKKRSAENRTKAPWIHEMCWWSGNQRDISILRLDQYKI